MRPLLAYLSPMERSLDKFTVDDGCWEWIGSKLAGSGYGRIHSGPGAELLAHRLIYEQFRGEIGPGLQLDHLCRNHACVRPAHLEAVTSRTNTLRGESPSAQHARQTECKHGHAYDLTNTYVRPDGRRQCRACDRAEHRAKRIAVVHASEPELARA